jgi:hypothetical protein
MPTPKVQPLQYSPLPVAFLAKTVIPPAKIDGGRREGAGREVGVPFPRLFERVSTPFDQASLKVVK